MRCWGHDFSTNSPLSVYWPNLASNGVNYESMNSAAALDDPISVFSYWSPGGESIDSLLLHGGTAHPSIDRAESNWTFSEIVVASAVDDAMDCAGRGRSFSYHHFSKPTTMTTRRRRRRREFETTSVKLEFEMSAKYPPPPPSSASWLIPFSFLSLLVDSVGVHTWKTRLPCFKNSPSELCSLITFERWGSADSTCTRLNSTRLDSTCN